MLLSPSGLHGRVLTIGLTLWVSGHRLILLVATIVLHRLLIVTCCWLLVHLLCVFINGGCDHFLLAIVRCPVNSEPVLIKLVDILSELSILLVRLNDHLDQIHCFHVECLDVRNIVFLHIFDLLIDRVLDVLNSFNALLSQCIQLSIVVFPNALEFLDSVTLSIR